LTVIFSREAERLSTLMVFRDRDDETRTVREKGALPYEEESRRDKRSAFIRRRKFKSERARLTLIATSIGTWFP
jgi:hypothetical protein